MRALNDHIYVVISTNEDVHALTYACKENTPLYKVHYVHACTLTNTQHTYQYCTETTVAGSWYRGCAYGLDKWYMSLFLRTSHDISTRELRARTLGTEIGHQQRVQMFRHVEPGRPLVCRLLKCASRNTLLM